jgi:hypothetical protein
VLFSSFQAIRLEMKSRLPLAALVQAGAGQQKLQKGWRRPATPQMSAVAVRRIYQKYSVRLTVN